MAGTTSVCAGVAEAVSCGRREYRGREGRRGLAFTEDIVEPMVKGLIWRANRRRLILSV